MQNFFIKLYRKDFYVILEKNSRYVYYALLINFLKDIFIFHMEHNN